MALVIEDGTIVSGANSFVTRAQIIAYALLRGVVIPDTAAVDANAINAMDYLLKFETRWKGELVSPGVQAQAWPRKCVKIGAYDFPENGIPVALINAQCQLAMYSFSGISLLPVGNKDAFVKHEKIGPIETEYSEAIALQVGNTPNFPAINLLLASILNGSGQLRAVRV